MSKPPQGWTEITVGDVGQWGSGGTPKSDNKSYYGGSIPWIRSGDLPDGPVVRHEVAITEQGLANSSAKWVPERAILIAMYGATIGKLGISTYPVTTNQAVAFCAVNDAVEPRFLFHALAAKKQELIDMGQGGAQPNISQQLLKAVKLYLPPLPEQQRIVAKLDGLISRTTRANIDLVRIPPLIARYKQRLLALAFSGQLFSDLHESNLFKTRLLEEAIISTFYGPRFGKEAYVTEGVPTLRTTDFDNAGNIVLKDPPKIAIRPKEYAKWGLLDGDLLITRTGSIGKCALYSEKIGPALPSAYLIRVRLDKNEILAKYALLFLLSGEGQRQLGAGITAVAQPNINAKVIAGLQLAIPPLEVQAEIVRRIESAFGWLDRMAADHAAAARLLPKLDAVVLAKALRGEIVPQDPNDEPASVLLARVNAERATAPKKSRERQPKVVNTSGESSIKVIATGTLIDGPKESGAKSMSKSRQDDDVMGKPYLAGLLKSTQNRDVQSLYRAADLPVADFYKQLSWEISKNYIHNSAKELKAI